MYSTVPWYLRYIHFTTETKTMHVSGLNCAEGQQVQRNIAGVKKCLELFISVLHCLVLSVPYKCADV